MGFQFRDQNNQKAHRIEINGQWYPVSADPQLQDKIAQHEQQMKQVMIAMIDTILGAGAAGRIFAGRAWEMQDLSDVLQYIGTELQDMV